MYLPWKHYYTIKTVAILVSLKVFFGTFVKGFIGQFLDFSFFCWLHVKHFSFLTVSQLLKLFLKWECTNCPTLLCIKKYHCPLPTNITSTLKAIAVETLSRFRQLWSRLAPSRPNSWFATSWRSTADLSTADSLKYSGHG